MKITILILEIFTGLLFFTTIVCGLWLRYSGEVITQSSKNFHMISGVLSGMLAIVLMLLISRQ